MRITLLAACVLASCGSSREAPVAEATSRVPSATQDFLEASDGLLNPEGSSRGVPFVSVTPAGEFAAVPAGWHTWSSNDAGRLRLLAKDDQGVRIIIELGLPSPPGLGWDRHELTDEVLDSTGHRVRRKRACYRLKCDFEFEEAREFESQWVVLRAFNSGEKFDAGQFVEVLRKYYPIYLGVCEDLQR